MTAAFPRLAAAADTADCTFSTTPQTTCWRRFLHGSTGTTEDQTALPPSKVHLHCCLVNPGSTAAPVKQHVAVAIPEESILAELKILLLEKDLGRDTQRALAVRAGSVAGPATGENVARDVIVATTICAHTGRVWPL